MCVCVCVCFEFEKGKKELEFESNLSATHRSSCKKNSELRSQPRRCSPAPLYENQEWWVKDYFIPRGTLPTHPATPKKGKYDMMDFLTNTLQYLSLKLPDLNPDFLFQRPPFLTSCMLYTMWLD